ncbi:MAG: hypothetical protein LPJ93_03440 [Rhodobacterales bacterium]|nr:hypothetical protein [Rhodobacterales bacterium]
MEAVGAEEDVAVAGGKLPFDMAGQDRRHGKMRPPSQAQFQSLGQFPDAAVQALKTSPSVVEDMNTLGVRLQRFEHPRIPAGINVPVMRIEVAQIGDAQRGGVAEVLQIQDLVEMPNDGAVE